MRKGKQGRREQDHVRSSDQTLTINPINNGKQQQKQPPCSAQQNTLSSEVPQTPRNRQKSKVYVSKTPKAEVGSSYSNNLTEKKVENVEEKGKSSDGFASELMNSTINSKEELHEEVKGVVDVSRLLDELSLVGEEVELSEEQLNSNDQLQEYEIMAMEAIYGDDVTILRKEGSRRSFQIHIPIDTPDELTISAKLCVSNENVKLEEKSTSTTATDDLSNEISYTFEVQHLPPIVLTCLLTKSYPSHQPPYFTISIQWLDSLRISKLCRMLDSLWADQPNQEVIHQWVEWLHSSSLSYLGIDKDMVLGPYNLPVTGDKRAVSGSVSPEVDIPLLMKYNDEKCHEVFRENLHECCICFSEYTGHLSLCLIT
ncbi:NDR1/HIN1-like [Thalictrum thalictroides]|uniref:NDR1/HIN1-like n=1 Tax=Thalictrum thalictroides TaxID=46969 RepID=A0A7J6WGP1_THATH|nr:NDR1/HIN1-like [Thalictrum thalictroides]